MRTGPGRWRRWGASSGRDHHRRGCQQDKTKGQHRRSPPVGQKAMVANTDKTVGEDMEQEAAQELRYRDGQGAFLVAMCGVPPAKGDLVLV